MKILPPFLNLLVICGAGCVVEVSIGPTERDKGLNGTLSGLNGDWRSL